MAIGDQDIESLVGRIIRTSSSDIRNPTEGTEENGIESRVIHEADQSYSEVPPFP